MRNYLLYAVSMFLSLGFALLYHVIATHFLEPSEYARLSIWLAPIIVTAIVAVGYQQYVAREIALRKKVAFPKEFLYPSIIFAFFAFFSRNFIAYVFLPFIFLLSHYRGYLQNIRKFELAFNLFFEAGLRVTLLAFFLGFGLPGALASFTIPFLLASLPSLKGIEFGKLQWNFAYFSLSTLLIYFPTNFSLMIAPLVLSLSTIAKLAAFLNLSKAILIISASSLMEYLVKETTGEESRFFPFLIILGIAIPFIVFPQVTGIFGSFYVSEVEFRILCISMVFASILFLYVNKLWSERKEREATYFLLFYVLLHIFLLIQARNLFQATLSYLIPAVIAAIAIILKVEILNRTCATSR